VMLVVSHLLQELALHTLLHSTGFQVCLENIIHSVLQFVMHSIGYLSSCSYKIHLVLLVLDLDGRLLCADVISRNDSFTHCSDGYNTGEFSKPLWRIPQYSEK